MPRRAELLALLASDVLALLLAFAAFARACRQGGWLDPADAVLAPEPAVVAALTLGWLVLFLFAGLYHERFAASRFDEVVTLGKAVALGALLLFFGLFIDRMTADAARIALAVYGGAVAACVGAGRLAVRAVQKALILRGRGLHRAVVVGWSERVEELYGEVARYPQAGLQIVGAVRLQRQASGVPTEAVAYAGGAKVEPGWAGAPSAGDGCTGSADEVVPALAAGPSIAELPRLIDRLGVQDVLIALGPGDHAFLDEVLRVCDGKAGPDGRPVALKLVPDFYAAVGGMARTEHMYGLPLIEVLPQPTSVWERHTKRLVDVVVAAVVLVVGLPVWLAVGALVRASSPGPAIYRQTRVGRGGRPFTMWKFRTMVHGAERETGPVWARQGDGRVTPVGAVLRRWRLDEVPQLWNVLRGEMSLVGPRPERPFFVEKLGREIPLYARRHRVQPGLTGLAQVKWRYDGDLDDVRQKLKYDLFYIENMSLGMDLKVLFYTIRTALAGRGH